MKKIFRVSSIPKDKISEISMQIASEIFINEYGNKSNKDYFFYPALFMQEFNKFPQDKRIKFIHYLNNKYPTCTKILAPYIEYREELPVKKQKISLPKFPTFSFSQAIKSLYIIIPTIAVCIAMVSFIPPALGNLEKILKEKKVNGVISYYDKKIKNLNAFLNKSEEEQRKIEKNITFIKTVIKKVKENREFYCLCPLPKIKAESLRFFITSRHGKRIDPIRKNKIGGPKIGYHKGIDIKANRGDTIVAAQDGIVEYAGWKTGYGWVVQIKHDQYKKVVRTHYAHLLKKPEIKIGQKIKRGDVVGLIGKTGRTTGYHLDFEIWENNRYVNPEPRIVSEKTLKELEKDTNVLEKSLRSCKTEYERHSVIQDSLKEERENLNNWYDREIHNIKSSNLIDLIF